MWLGRGDEELDSSKRCDQPDPEQTEGGSGAARHVILLRPEKKKVGGISLDGTLSDRKEAEKKAKAVKALRRARTLDPRYESGQGAGGEGRRR